MEPSLPPGPTVPRVAQVARWILRPVPFAIECQARYGDMFTLRVENAPWVMLADPEAIREVFSARPELVHAGEANEILRPTLGPRSILLLDDADHLRQRKLMLGPFHGERMQRYRDAMVDVTEHELERMPVGRPFAMRPHMQAITLEVIMRAVFGARTGELGRLRELLATMLDTTARPRRLLMLALMGPNNTAMRRLSQRELAPLDAELHRVIAQRRAAPDLDERDDILSMLLLAVDEDGVGLTDAELRDELVTLLVAGHETTATSLAWAFERLARHPEMLDRLVADEPYRDAVVKETLRLRPVIAVVLRTLTEPMEVAGRLLPAGAKVVPCILLVHRRTDLYPEPAAFAPERFLNGGGPGAYGWIPFGGGVRRCLGAAFAQMEMSVVLATVAGRVRLEAVGPPERVSRRAITFVPARGGEVRVVGAR